jgi:hypothetical protein
VEVETESVKAAGVVAARLIAMTGRRTVGERGAAAGVRVRTDGEIRVATVTGVVVVTVIVAEAGTGVEIDMVETGTGIATETPGTETEIETGGAEEEGKIVEVAMRALIGSAPLQRRGDSQTQIKTAALRRLPTITQFQKSRSTNLDSTRLCLRKN